MPRRGAFNAYRCDAPRRHQARGARVRQRMSALLTIPSSQPRDAEQRMIQTSEVLDDPTTQLNSTWRVFAATSATRQTISATVKDA